MLRLAASSFLLLFLFSFTARAQAPTGRKLTLGVEQDLLPYATGGYFAGLWAGKGHLRVRALTARVHKPDLIVKKGFTNNRVTAYALVGDYFLHQNWKGWWAGSGLVYWKSSIQAGAKSSTAYYENLLINGSLGYHQRLFGPVYLSPWAGMHLRVGGAKKVAVDGKVFTPPLLNPEASLKLGICF
ncbi:hypothetical protein V9K67_09890 [Paraflavisolibacter sp. H34]|uniref:hypothetical protein n=1 Tax=Huijunlia imazamoxiresistens TaxID=3127457 RepID=UPI00301843CD